MGRVRSQTILSVVLSIGDDLEQQSGGQPSMMVDAHGNGVGRKESMGEREGRLL